MILSIQHSTGDSVRRICKTLQLPRSSFFHAENPTLAEVSDKAIGQLIEDIFHHHERRYGYRRIREEMRDHNIQCDCARIRRLMKERGLRAIQPKKSTPKTSDGKASLIAPNLLAERGVPSQLDLGWAGDITYIPVGNRWAYLAVVIDLCSRRVIGWSLDWQMSAGLVIDAFEKALETRDPKSGVTFFHSDQGSQYSSGNFRSLLKEAGILQSMSARATPQDNAWTESFIGTLKAEMINEQCLETLPEAHRAIFKYTEAYYNTQRKHSSLNYKTPLQFETKILTLI